MNALCKSSLLATTFLLCACGVFKVEEGTPAFANDVVCGKKVARAEACTWKFNGEKYFFDIESCRESFKMNPHKFIDKK